MDGQFIPAKGGQGRWLFHQRPYSYQPVNSKE